MGFTSLTKWILKSYTVAATDFGIFSGVAAVVVAKKEAVSYKKAVLGSCDF